MRYAIVCTLVLMGACASNQTAVKFSDRPMVASLRPIGAAPAKPASIDPNDAPGALLERGLRFYSEDEHENASLAFNAAINTGRLNDAGRALAYWHIHEAESRLGDRDASADALTAFVVVAEDIISMREHVRYAVSDAGDFVDRFDLPTKLDHARAGLSVQWAGRAQGFGRTAKQPIPVRTDEELNYFLEMASPCQGMHRRTVSRRETETDDGVHQVTLTCGSREPVLYFFEVP